GALNSSITDLTAVGNQLFFVLDDTFTGTNVNGAELWVTDGTAANTHLVKDILPGPDSSAPDELTNLDGRLYFTADDEVDGVELWQSDGTSSGTYIVADLYAGSNGYFGNSSRPHDLTVMNTATPKTLMFGAFSPAVGDELWKVVND